MRHIFFSLISLTLLTACSIPFLKAKEAKTSSSNASPSQSGSPSAHQDDSLHGNYKKYKSRSRCKKHCRRHHHKHYDPDLAGLNSNGRPKTVQELIKECYKLCDQSINHTSTNPVECKK